MISTLIFMTFLGVLIFALLQQTLFLQRWKKIQHECRLNTFKTQDILRKGFEDLINLNPQAKALRIEEKLAQIEVKVASDPWTKSAAKAHLLAVRARQLLLRQQQQAIILKTKSQARLVKREFKHQSFGLDIIPFAIRPVPPTSNSPSYVIPPQISKLQKIEVPWTYLFKNKKLKGVCGTTMTQTSKLRIQFLYPGASLLKGFSF